MTDNGMSPIEFSRQLNQWIGKWATGEVKDQTAIYLDKVVKQKALEVIGTDKPGASKVTAETKAAWCAKWLKAAASGAEWARGGPYIEAAAELERVMAEAAEQALEAADRQEYAEHGHEIAPQPAPQPRVADAPRYDAGVENEVALELERVGAENARLRTELARAHDWRYNLESRARDAYAAVREVLGSPTAPTKQAVSAILQTLRDGIEWTP